MYTITISLEQRKIQITASTWRAFQFTEAAQVSFNWKGLQTPIWKLFWKLTLKLDRSSHPEVFLGKSVLKICSKFTGEHPCWSTISIKLLCNFIEIALWYGCSPLTLLQIFRAPFLRTPLDGCFWLELVKLICYKKNGI